MDAGRSGDCSLPPFATQNGTENKNGAEMLCLTTDPPMIPTCASRQVVEVFRQKAIHFCPLELLAQRNRPLNVPILV